MSSEPPKSPLAVPALPNREAGANAASPAEALQPGDVLDGRYVLQDPIGEGGVGLIFRAIQFKVQRPVAVKFLQREMVGEHSLKPRFEREAMALAALAHPNIVRLHDYGIARGNPFLVMEFIEGRTLRGVLNDEGSHLAWPRAFALTRQILYALSYAHERGIVHRDLKPANLIVQAFPQQPEHLKVLDFGFAKFLPGSELDLGAQLTRAGHTFGSPPYMSPEHATGSAVDGRSDLYSVGILLFEMLTGKRPFEGEIHELLRHHLTTPVPPLAERRPELASHPEFQTLIDRALAKSRDARFADAGAFLRALDAAERAAEAIDGQVTLVVAPRSSAPSFGNVGRASAIQLARLRRHAFPKLVRWSGALLQRLWRRA
ncbi:MAG TPA: serine/threonine-protein kinase [Polyangiales bacterium]|nr:serine/threonine-protein kinase [Polyangiales bacterium]